MEFPKHPRTASKTLQTFRFICKYTPSNKFISSCSATLLFKVQDSWSTFKTLPNITTVTSFSMCYVFEELLDIKVEIHQQNQLIDEKTFNLVFLISKTHHEFSSRAGVLNIDIEEVKDNNSALSLKISARLKGGFLFWRPHYRLIIQRQIAPNSYLNLYETESASGGKCRWKKFTLPYNILGESPVKIDVHNNSDEVVASVSMGIHELLSPGRRFDLISPSGNKGTLKIAWSELQLQQNFVDYLRAGLKINVIVAVDYTSSNLPYGMVLSNHYLSPTTQNPYEESMKRIVDVLDVYNKDHVIHFFGFGGVPEGESVTSHCFSLGRAVDSASLLKLYRESLPRITMSKPTIMNEIITKAQKICEEDRDPNSYCVVIVLTDGDIHDYPQTSTNIVYSCRFPLSFIIVGIGNADFASMVRLDSDGVQLRDREGRIAERDIVQFVPYNLYKYHPGLLAAKVLEEVPDQICGYMAQRARK